MRIIKCAGAIFIDNSKKHYWKIKNSTVVLNHSPRKIYKLTWFLCTMLHKGESTVKIKYFNNNTSRLYECIDEKLCILGGTEEHRMFTGANMMYIYDFPNIGKAVVFIPSDSKDSENKANIKKTGSVTLLGFTYEPFYNQMHRGLVELHNYKF